jgi:UDP-glucuronate 4-epimerase
MNSGTRPFNRIFVTGAAGFIGFHLVRRLCADGYAVHGFDNLNPYYDVQLKHDRLAILQGQENFSFTQGDLADRGAVDAVFEQFKPDVVVNLAAQAGVRYSLENPQAYVDANVTGFLNILEGCRHHAIKHLVFASSSSVYGGNTKQPFAECDPIDHPVSMYAATKRANELMAHTYAHLFGVPCSGVRFFTVYGPWGRPDMAYFKFLKAAYAGQTIDVYNNGEMKRDFTYIDDIVEGLVRLIPVLPEPDVARGADAPDRSWAPYRLYNIGNHDPVDLMEMIKTLEEESGVGIAKKFLPMQAGDVQATYADTQRLNEVTGFAPATPLREGLRAFVRWYRDYYKIGNGPAAT